MAQIKDLTATTPDATLKAVAKTGKYGSGGLAKLAHVNDVINWIKDAGLPGNEYATNADAKTIGLLVVGDLYHTAGVLKIVI